MSVQPTRVQRINLFQDLNLEQCKLISSKVEMMTSKPHSDLLVEGEVGNTLLLIFQGEVEVSNQIMIKTKSGFSQSRKAIVRLKTTDPAPAEAPVSEPTTFVVEEPAFATGEYALVSDEAIRTANVTTMTPTEYGVLTFQDFSQIVEDDPAIAGPVFRRVARNAVEKVKTGNADIANLTQAFFYALSRG